MYELGKQPTVVSPGASTRQLGGGPSVVDADELFAALRTVPFGAPDNSSRHLPVSAQVQASIPPTLNAVRWATVTYGMIFGAQRAFGGSYSIVVALGICLFITSWRTIIPVQLGAPDFRQQIVALVDVVIMGVAVGMSGAPSSPFIYCLLAMVIVPALGWGYRLGAIGFAVGWTTTIIAALASDTLPNGVDMVLVTVVCVSAALIAATAFTRDRLIEAEENRRLLSGQISTLAEANDLLTMLNSVARSLPTSLNQREALDNARQQISETFENHVLCLFEFDDAHDEWVPKLTEGASVQTAISSHDLPAHLRQAVDGREPWLVSDLTLGSIRGIDAGSGSGLYTKLVARGRTVALLGIEHRTPGFYTERDRLLLAGMADIMALTLDNARWFGRLRSLGAEQERIRIARDLHDRLGQWLTYISFELERFISDTGGDQPQLTQLHEDVQTALDELRETLRQLRSSITDGRPLSLVAKEQIQRFSERTKLAVRFEVTDPNERLAVPIENELLRILQEALNNVDKHADASTVTVTWSVAEGSGALRIVDDGRGFNPSRGVRESAYGLVGMRERADVIGARISIDSAVNHGTTVYVTVGSIPAQKEG